MDAEAEKQDQPTGSLLGRCPRGGRYHRPGPNSTARSGSQQYLEQPKQLGVILVELGYATKQNITDVLAKHGGQMRLGDMLLEQDLITEEALEHALVIQRDTRD